MDDVDLDHPSVARVYDYYLGGNANYAVDRVFGEMALTAFPFVRPAAKANRLYLRRVVHYLIQRGVRQFVDIGSGVTTSDGGTHRMADELGRVKGARVVYVDHEPVTVLRSQLQLEQHGDPKRHAVVQADLREPDLLWRKVRESGVVDLRQPVAILLMAVLHVVQPGPDGTDVSAEAVARLRELMPRGSYLALSHGTTDGVSATLAHDMDEFARLYDRTPARLHWRSRAEIETFFGDLPLVEPGATWCPLWHPELARQGEEIRFTDPGESMVWVGVAHKP
ncbi:methyltransferase [Amycolatopsis rhizosphaerae]|uniref:Methyltransferase n=1 Tax=Amycolatopsis rhizosphaerae TaxID=2053003 RepID=A0A558CGN4_9PSEU|nr:SAM-dependent methyltransferase [Amycolatopsis rhizosphaerae]TVT47929.1 methyltransferase [Amycolatopsis rhizosphaerae]